jgi:amino acid permease
MVTEPEEKPAAPTLFQVVGSVLAAFFGVQSYKNRERDFTAGKPWVFIAVAVAMTLLFIGVLFAVVSVVLSHSHAPSLSGDAQDPPSASRFNS